jgi:hypothetical protein
MKVFLNWLFDVDAFNIFMWFRLVNGLPQGV